MLDYVASWMTVKTLLVGLVTALFVHWFTRKMKYKLPPGPFALPLVGNMLQFKTGMIHEEIFEMSKKYGPVMSIYLGPQLAIFVNDIKSAMEALVKKGADFASRPSAPSICTELMRSPYIEHAASGLPNPTRMEGRHFMQGDALDERIHKAVTTIFDEMQKETTPFDPVKYINFMMGNILLGLCYGGTFKFDDRELNRLIQIDDELILEFGGIGLPEDLIPGLKYVWESPGMRRIKAGFQEAMDTVIAKKYWEHVNSFDKDKIRDFADMLILAREEAESDPDEADLDKLTDTHIIQTLADIFFAGIDTSRLNLRFAILHMVAYPEIQKKVQEEVDRVVDGYDLPKNTMVVINHWALHHDPNAWENVSDFIPERFLDKYGKMGPKPENWLPFSAGRRVCLGESVAKPELHLLFACLMQRFTWQMPEGKKVDLSPTGNSFALFPRPHELIVEERMPKAQ